MYATTIWLLHSIFPHYLMFPLLVSFLSVTLNHSYGITWFLSLSLGYHNSSFLLCVYRRLGFPSWLHTVCHKHSDYF